MIGARLRLTERCWRTSASSKSLTVVPSSMRPNRVIPPVANSSASVNVVLPAPVRPTNATLRILPGWSASGALPAKADPDFSAIRHLLVVGAARADAGDPNHGAAAALEVD